MICPHDIGHCTISSNLAKIEVPIDTKACDTCKGLAKPMQVNSVTCSRAIWALRNAKQSIPKSLLEPIRAEVVSGPGTELKKLVSWFIWNKNIRNCKTCATREQRMNRWGPDRCQKNILTIIEWLRESAVKHGYPFSERVAASLIRKAIDNSRK